MAADGGAAQARLRWELENQIGPAPDAELYRWDPAEQQALQQQRPWARDPHYFKQLSVCVGLAALCSGRVGACGLSRASRAAFCVVWFAGERSSAPTEDATRALRDRARAPLSLSVATKTTTTRCAHPQNHLETHTP